MKGLTPEEYRMLENSAKPTVTDPSKGFVLSPAEEDALDDLHEQGRVMPVRIETDEESAIFYDVTPAGREALRLWPLLRERFSREGSK